MAVSKWAALTKKQADGETEPPPAKVLCTHFEKSLKKMEGNLVLVKDRFHAQSLQYSKLIPLFFLTWSYMLHVSTFTSNFSKPLSGAAFDCYGFEGKFEVHAASWATYPGHLGGRPWRDDCAKLGGLVPTVCCQATGHGSQCHVQRLDVHSDLVQCFFAMISMIGIIQCYS